MTIVMVDSASVDEATLAMNAGDYTYLTKPFNKEKDEDLSDLNQYIKLRNKQLSDIHKAYASMLLSSETDKKFELILKYSA